MKYITYFNNLLTIINIYNLALVKSRVEYLKVALILIERLFLQFLPPWSKISFADPI